MQHWKVAVGVLCVLATVHAGATELGVRSDSKVKVSAVAGTIDAAGKQMVTVTLVIDKTWHIYANPVKEESLDSIQTEIKINENAKVKLAKVDVKYPPGKLYKDKHNPKFTCMVYEDKVDIQCIVQRAPGDTGPLNVNVTFSACDDDNCLLPATKRIVLK